MGDAAHRLRRSAHNSGNALDVTYDPVNGPNLDRLVASFCDQMRANPGGRLRLIIWRRRIYSAGDLWRGRKYIGLNPHTSHVHLEVRPALRGEARSWRVDG